MELLSDEKETAEHNMLVYLGRNDIGKVAAGGTVKVTDFHEIVRFSHVMHISSTVIVGSEIVRLCKKYGRDAVPYVADYVKTMKKAVLQASKN